MRAPFVLLIALFAVAVAGLALIPGEDGDGNTVRMTVFDAFYFMSYTATTIGFGELPHEFTIPQRMWVTASIYSSVIGWAYAIGVLFSMMQDTSFQDALAVARFRRKVNRIREPFVVVAGYGRAGRQ
ncbi:MAG: potassium transporter TrkA, partial [Actinobacteria bacterium]|nr:potassium transporter TrkA [Actinomycetota bacterium]